MEFRNLGDLAPNLADWVERAERVLEDNPDLSPRIL